MSKLAVHVNENRHRPHVWGSHDCLLWALSAIRIKRDIDLAKIAKLRYKTPAGAMKLIKRYGFSAPEDIMENILGFGKPVANALVGDIVAVDLHKLGINCPGEKHIGKSLGVCLGHVSYFVGDEGLVPLETLKLDTAYHG